MTENQINFKEYGIELLSKLARTDMSEVWLASRSIASSTQYLVVKMEQIHYTASSPASRHAIINEELWLKKFSDAFPQNPGIVQLLPITTIRKKSIYRAKIFPNGAWFLLLEYLEGGSLNSIVQQRQLSFPVALNIAYRLAKTIEFMHQLGCVHLDLKPSNIMFRHTGSDKRQQSNIPVVIDFGLSHRIGERHFVGGVEEWLAPEVVAAKKAGTSIEIQPTMDILPFGRLISYLLTGRRPTTRFEMQNVVFPKAILNHSKASSHSTISQVVAELNELLFTMTNPNPIFRPNASDVVTQLHDCYSALGVIFDLAREPSVLA